MIDKSFWNINRKTCYLLKPYSFSQREIQDLNTELQISCEPLLSAGDELVKNRKVQKNVTQAIESLSLCLPGKLDTI